MSSIIITCRLIISRPDSISSNKPLLRSSNSHMEDHKEKNGSWMSVPQFGDWDQKGNMLDYSLDFSKIREMRKHNKRDISRTSIGNDEELIPQRNNNNNINNNNNNDGGGRRKLEEEKLHYKQGFDEETQRRCGGIGC
ncbi:hypothetical protein GIB67_013860 [Kingdonia uniflora]|uniref:RIN4 pathogenic type III effector avirulence factor Avr cleavage site domain-containing protein n=1 Tax=Kingdonia uniflora TaxID=39325 RepID=A0A7J7KW78_9MAGN|nr:hypothetical protein GIB67_013860 [Kingdonia uniflora]